MKTSQFKTDLLEIIFPPIREVYEQKLIPKLSDISKPALQTMANKDKGNPLNNNDWAFLYLDEKVLYQEFNSNLSLAFSSIFSNQSTDEKLASELNNFMSDPIQAFHKLDQLVEQNSSLNANTSLNEEVINIDLLHKISIARLFNSLSVIQSGLRIGDLLKDFLEEGKQLSLAKAVKVDPSVLELKEIKGKINQLDPIAKNKLEGKLQNEKSIPHLTQDKRKQYLLLDVLLNTAASMGFLTNPNAIPNKTLQEMATNFEIIPVTFDESEFRKMTSYYRKR